MTAPCPLMERLRKLSEGEPPEVVHVGCIGYVIVPTRDCSVLQISTSRMGTQVHFWLDRLEAERFRDELQSDGYEVIAVRIVGAE